MRNFGPESPIPSERRAFAHTMISEFRAGNKSREEAEAAVAATGESSLKRDTPSGFEKALQRGTEVRIVRGGIGEQLFEPLLKARQQRQALNPREERALEVRRHVAAIIEDTQTLGAGTSHNARHRIQSRVMSRIGKLLELGVNPDTHTYLLTLSENSPSDPPYLADTSYLANPLYIAGPLQKRDALHVAEYAAGQVLTNLGVTIEEVAVENYLYPKRPVFDVTVNLRNASQEVAPNSIRKMLGI